MTLDVQFPDSSDTRPLISKLSGNTESLLTFNYKLSGETEPLITTSLVKLNLLLQDSGDTEPDSEDENHELDAPYR